MDLKGEQTECLRLAIEVCLVLACVILLLRRSFKPAANTPLTASEVDQLVHEWQPEPLVSHLGPSKFSSCAMPVVESKAGTHMSIGGAKKLNLVTLDFLGMSCREEVEKAACETISSLGVGSCGPRGFYGTSIVHLTLEQELSEFLGTDNAIVYPYDVATPSSLLSTFARRGDLILIDEGTSYPLRSGAQLSRAKVVFFKHNCTDDLQAKLSAELQKEQKKARKEQRRRYIVVEGIYADHGDTSPLPDILTLKERNGFRLMIDDSIAFGALAPRGSVEHWGVDARRVDILCASMSCALGSVGGFCAGPSKVIDHQRINASGYVFSASLPPYLAAAARASLGIFASSEGSKLVQELTSNSKALQAALISERFPCAHVVGEAVSPIKHVRIDQDELDNGTYPSAEAVVDSVYTKLLYEHGVHAGVSKHSALDRDNAPWPSIRLAVRAQHNKAELQQAASAIHSSFHEALYAVEAATGQENGR